MKKAALTEVKNLNIAELIKKVSILRGQLNELVMDKNMGKLKDTKSVFKSRKGLAQVLTILRQKQTLEQLEARSSSLDDSRNEKRVTRKRDKK